MLREARDEKLPQADKLQFVKWKPTCAKRSNEHAHPSRNTGSVPTIESKFEAGSYVVKVADRVACFAQIQILYLCARLRVATSSPEPSHGYMVATLTDTHCVCNASCMFINRREARGT